LPGRLLCVNANNLKTLLHSWHFQWRWLLRPFFHFHSVAQPLHCPDSEAGMTIDVVKPFREVVKGGFKMKQQT